MASGEDKGFVLIVVLVLAASMFAGNLEKNPTGLVTNPPANPAESGECKLNAYDPHPLTTSYNKCCGGSGKSIPGYSWNEILCSP
tara:strand:- start:3974 stop:4228 length:255 start_codon:yes stop_codon:yes gene_type:complete